MSEVQKDIKRLNIYLRIVKWSRHYKIYKKNFWGGRKIIRGMKNDWDFMLSHFKQQQNVIVRSSLEIRVSVGERKILTTYLGVSFRKRERLTEQNSEYICSISLNGNNDWLRAIHQYVYFNLTKEHFYNKCNKSRFT